MDKKLPKFVGTINIPGDKSISHRALIIGSQATGIVKVSNLLESADVFSTMNALRKFGVHIVKRGKYYHVYGLVVGGRAVEIHHAAGVGGRGDRKPANCHRSGRSRPQRGRVAR